MTFMINITLILVVQIIVYVIFLRPKIATWGATKEEAKMAMAGDKFAPHISATRAISIDSSIAEVWNWVIQLGADRGGFFSYAFIEKALGYEKRDSGFVPDFHDMEVGRVVPGSIDESKSVIKFNFPVVAVAPGTSFVLEEWGTFLLKEINAKQTRLIVRSQGVAPQNLLEKVTDFFLVPAHYIMERRMLLGFKSCAETGELLPAKADNLWLLGVLLSGIGLGLMALLGKDFINILLSVIYGIIWLWVLLIPKPDPKNSTLLLIAEIVTLFWLF